MQDKASGQINSVDHALRLIEVLHEFQPLSVSELARRLDLPRPTVYRLLRTFDAHNLIVQEAEGYRLSLRLLELASTTLSVASLQDAAQPVLKELAQATGETAHFAVLDGDRVSYVAKVDSPHPIRMFSRVGWRGPLHATGTGKALLAWSPPSLLASVLAEPLERLTRHTLIEPPHLIEELERARTQGYALDNEELIEGLVCVAAPVLAGNRLIGALSVAGPVDRFSDPARFVPELEKAARAMRDRL
jgi:IclR family acetate operon transcriptional repressor